MADTTPDKFTLTDKADCPPDTMVTSNAITVRGITGDAPVSVQYGEWRKNDGTWTTRAGLVRLGDRVQVRRRSGSKPGEEHGAKLTIGGVSEWFVTKVAGAAPAPAPTPAPTPPALALPPLASGQIRPTQWTPGPKANVIYGRAGTLGKDYWNTKINAMKDYNFHSPDDNELWFQVRPGDRMSADGWTDPTTSERAEIYFDKDHYPNGREIHIEYEVCFPDGPDYQSTWSVHGQMHPGTGAPYVPVELCFEDQQGKNQLVLLRKYGATREEGRQVFKCGNGPVPRGRFHKIEWDVVFGKSGFLKARWNGDLIADYSGPMGPDMQTSCYTHYGCYRHETDKIFDVGYRNIRQYLV